MKSGRCLCNEVKFEIGDEVRWIGACHCRMCQRQSGGAFQVWVAFHVRDFKILSGQLKKYQSSVNVIRSSCPTCSSPLFFQYLDKPEDIYVVGPALDGPDLKPQEHIWWSSKAEWLCLNDGAEIRSE